MRYCCETPGTQSTIQGVQPAHPGSLEVWRPRRQLALPVLQQRGGHHHQVGAGVAQHGQQAGWGRGFAGRGTRDQWKLTAMLRSHIACGVAQHGQQAGWGREPGGFELGRHEVWERHTRQYTRLGPGWPSMGSRQAGGEGIQRGTHEVSETRLDAGGVLQFKTACGVPLQTPTRSTHEGPPEGAPGFNAAHPAPPALPPPEQPHHAQQPRRSLRPGR